MARGVLSATVGDAKARLLARPRWLVDATVASVLTALALGAGAGALLLAEFGGPVWMLVAFLVPLLTFGLPSLAAVLLLTSFWPGPSLRAFLLIGAVLAFGFQFASVALVRRWMAARTQ